jgi:glycosyltransferase involved in cell wall biosynthesis
MSAAPAVPVLRVLHLLPHLERGGTQRWLLDLIAACRGHGAKLDHHVAVLGSRDEMVEDFRTAGVPLHRVPFDASGPRAKGSAVRALRHLAQELHVDIVQAHSRFDRPYAYLLGTLTGVPVVDTLHSEYAATRYGHRFVSTAGMRDAAERLLERCAPVSVVAVSPHLIDLLLATPSRRGHTTVSLPPTVARSFMTTLAPVPGGNGPLRLIAVARLVAGKGLDLVVDALPEIQRVRAGSTLTIVGDGPERARLEAMALAAGLGSSVHFLGDRDDVDQLLAQHELFVLPSRSEGMPKAVLEAAAAGLHVCVPRLPGLGPLLGEMERLTWIESLDADGVSGSVIGAAAVPDQVTAQTRDVARLRARLGADAFVAALEDAYRTAVEGRGSRGRGGYLTSGRRASG